MDTENMTAKSLVYTTVLPTFGTISLDVLIVMILLNEIHMWQSLIVYL